MGVRDLGTSMLAVGGFVVVADLLNIANSWPVGVALWVLGILLYISPGERR